MTIADPQERIDRFSKTLVSRLPVAEAWTIIAAAMDDQHPNHKSALAECKKAAHALGKGWPRAWPTDRRTH